MAVVILNGVAFRALRCVSVIFAITVFGLGASAQQRPDLTKTLATLSPTTGEARISQTPSGDLTYLGAPAGASFDAGKQGKPEDIARNFLLGHATSFGIRSAAVDFSVLRVQPGKDRDHVRLNQSYNGLRVFGAQAIIQVGKNGGVESAAVDILRNTATFDNGKTLTSPSISAEAAAALAVKSVPANHGDDYSVEADPELLIYAPAVVGEYGAPVLAWSLIVSSKTPGYRQQIFVNAATGEIALSYSLIHTAKNRQIYDSNNTTANPGTLVRTEGAPASAVADVNFAYDYFGDTYDFYFDNHGRDSLDGAGSVLSGTVRYCEPGFECPFENAFWNGSRMFFGQGFSAADDVVSHELTHGVTTNTSDLIYLNQSGAINESFSDVWGEYVDLTNSGGTDTPEVRWLLGEDVPVFGAIRDMQDPPVFGHPDRTCSPIWYSGAGDNGGVHINSGVNNKLCYLLTDGDTFNGQTVTAMGIPLVADLYYEVQTNLISSGASYLDLYNALTQAAINLGFTADQKENLERACLAIEITEETNCQLPPPPPENDLCTRAIPIEVGRSYSGNTASATGNGELCGYGDFNDVWYTFTPPLTDTYTISLCGTTSGVDTTLGLFSGICSELSRIACNDDSCGLRSQITRTLTMGVTYRIGVAGYAGSGGPFNIRVDGTIEVEGDPGFEGEEGEYSPEGEDPCLGVGVRVRLLVNNPDDSACLLAGNLGTIVCDARSATDFDWLVEWDGSDCGHDGNGFCTPTTDADAGWYVYGYQIEAVEPCGEGEGSVDGEEGELPPEGEAEDEGEEGEPAPDGEGEGTTEGEGEGQSEGDGEGDFVFVECFGAEGEGAARVHSADQNANGTISLSELLRVIQFFNSGGLSCAIPPESTEDGYEPGPGDTNCTPHDGDYNPMNFAINLSELLRIIQFFNSGAYYHCPTADPLTEDGYCPCSGHVTT